MKRFFNKIKDSGLFLFAITLAAALFGITGVDAMVASAPVGTAMGQPASEHGDAALGGHGAMGEGWQSLQEALEISPNLVTETVHKEVIKITPWDFAARSLMANNFRHKKRTNDHKVVVFSVASKDVQVKVATAHSETSAAQSAVDFGAGNKLIAINETIYFGTMKGYDSDGDQQVEEPLICYVVNKDSDGKPILKALNGKAISDVISVPSIAKDVVAIRGSRIGSETQLRTDPVNVLPTDRTYYVQKNIIEFMTTGWFDSASKKVKWDDRDLMEMAVGEKIRTSMADFWKGKSRKAYIANKFNENREELTYFSEGIWWQAGREYDFNSAPIDVDALIDFASYVFKGNRSSSEKILFMGSELSATLQKVIFNNPTFLGETYRDNDLKINFTSISFFGGKKILFVDDPSLDDQDMSDCGFVMDMKYAYEYHYGMKTVKIDEEKQARRDVRGTAIVEENAFILTNNEAHCRIKL